MNKVNLKPDQLKFIKDALKPYSKTVIYGSRVKGINREYSDLDVCLKDLVSAYEYELLVEKFENSDLPFKIDLSEYSKLSDKFKKIIDTTSILLTQSTPQNN